MITLQSYSFFQKKQTFASSFTNIYANFAVEMAFPPKMQQTI